MPGEDETLLDYLFRVGRERRGARGPRNSLLQQQVVGAETNAERRRAAEACMAHPDPGVRKAARAVLAAL